MHWRLHGTAKTSSNAKFSNIRKTLNQSCTSIIVLNLNQIGSNWVWIHRTNLGSTDLNQLSGRLRPKTVMRVLSDTKFKEKMVVNPALRCWMKWNHSNISINGSWLEKNWCCLHNRPETIANFHWTRQINCNYNSPVSAFKKGSYSYDLYDQYFFSWKQVLAVSKTSSASISFNSTLFVRFFKSSEFFATSHIDLFPHFKLWIVGACRRCRREGDSESRQNVLIDGTDVRYIREPSQLPSSSCDFG